jgi:hypothetical protein
MAEAGRMIFLGFAEAPLAAPTIRATGFARRPSETAWRCALR